MRNVRSCTAISDTFTQANQIEIQEGGGFDDEFAIRKHRFVHRTHNVIAVCVRCQRVNHERVDLALKNRMPIDLAEYRTKSAQARQKPLPLVNICCAHTCSVFARSGPETVRLTNPTSVFVLHDFDSVFAPASRQTQANGRQRIGHNDINSDIDDIDYSSSNNDSSSNCDANRRSNHYDNTWLVDACAN